MASAYSDAQIACYLAHINLPQHFHPAANPALDLAYLTALHVHQISAIPYENLSLHYSVDHQISLDLQVLYAKLVLTGRGRGGYCMENSIFYNHVLRALGFKVYTAGVRIRLRTGGVPAGDFVGFRHIVNIVTLADGTKYMVDVGFGGDGATKPVPLVDAHKLHNLGTQEIRLVHNDIPAQTHRGCKLWIYQYRNGRDTPWNSYYAFGEFEFLECDFEIINYYTSTHPESFQTHAPLVVKFLRRDNEIYGKVMMFGAEVKRNIGGKTELVQTCKTEEERVKALEQWFGIELTKEEKEGIKGVCSELPRN